MLKNNFTTPEQSKILLGLGLPADSADCYYSETIKHIVVIDAEIDKKEFFRGDIVPYWSVGRLIEISRVCTTLTEKQYMFPFWYDTQDNVEWAIRIIESGVRTEHMDFSKLEE